MTFVYSIFLLAPNMNYENVIYEGVPLTVKIQLPDYGTGTFSVELALQGMYLSWEKCPYLQKCQGRNEKLLSFSRDLILSIVVVSFNLIFQVTISKKEII